MNEQTQKLQESIQLQNYMLRPARYVNIDGSFELGWGTAILLGALNAYLPVLLPNARWAGPLGWLLLLCFALSPYLIPKAIKKYIREYPWKWLLLVLLVLGPLGIGLIAPDNWFELSQAVILSRPVMLFVSLVWLISGGATLYAYLRHTKPPAPEPA